MEIVSGIHCIDRIKGAHVYLLLLPELTIIDTGLPGQEQAVIDYLQRLNYRPDDLRYIILTHFDIDHVGSAAALRKITGAKVCAGDNEIPYLNGSVQRPGIKRFLPWLTAPIYGKVEPVQVDVTFKTDQRFNELNILSTPGHTPGHICITFGSTAIVGDLLQGGIQEAPSIFIWNMELARESIQKLARANPATILPGHGEPCFDPGERLQKLILSWNIKR